MNRRDFLKCLPLAPLVFLQESIGTDYQPIGYVDVRIHRGLHRYRVLDKHTGEDLTLKDKIVWADDRAGCYGRYKEPVMGTEDINLETVKREIIIVNDLSKKSNNHK